MFDEDTIIDLLSTPLSDPQSPLSVEKTRNNHYMALNFSTSLFNSALVSKRKLPDYCSMNPPRKRSSKVPTDKLTMSLAMEAVNNFSFKNFSWQSIQTDNSQPIQ